VVFISKIDGGCSNCMTIAYDGNEVAAGASKEIRIRVTADTQGSRNFHLVVHLTDRAQPTVEAWLRYVLYPVLLAAPSTVDFGECLVGEEVVEAVQVHCQVPKSLAEFAVAPVLEGEGPVTSVVGKPVRTPLTDLVDRYELTVTLTAKGKELSREPFAMNLVFPEGLAPKLVVPIRGRIVQQRFLEQDRFHLGILKAGEARRRAFRIPFQADGEVVVKGVTSSAEYLVADAVIPPGERLLALRITVTPPAAGDFREEVWIKTNLQEEPFRIVVAGRAR